MLTNAKLQVASVHLPQEMRDAIEGDVFETGLMVSIEIGCKAQEHQIEYIHNLIDRYVHPVLDPTDWKVVNVSYESTAVSYFYTSSLDTYSKWDLITYAEAIADRITQGAKMETDKMTGINN